MPCLEWGIGFKMNKETKPWFENKGDKYKESWKGNEPEEKGKLKVWKDRDGRWITFKEFMERWRKGIEGLSQLQIIKTQLHSMKLVFLGIILGLIFSVLAFKQLFWLFIILLGSLGITLSQYVALWQKKKAHEDFENRLKKLK